MGDKHRLLLIFNINHSHFLPIYMNYAQVCGKQVVSDQRLCESVDVNTFKIQVLNITLIYSFDLTIFIKPILAGAGTLFGPPLV